METKDANAAVLEAFPDPCLLLTTDGVVVAANRRARSILEVSPEELCGMRLDERVAAPPETVQRFLHTASGGSEPVPGTLVLPGGNEDRDERRISCQAARVPPEAGEDRPLVLIRFQEEPWQPSAFVLLNRKIDELNREIARRRRVEEALERSHLFLTETQQIARLGSWEWDIESDAITWSEELYRIYGVDPEDGPLDFDGFLSLVAPRDRDRVAGAVERALESGGSFSFDHGIVRPDGERRILHGRGRAFTDEEGRPVRVIGSGQDITERRRREDQRRFLAEAGRTLASSLDYEETLRHVARLAVPDIADWCAVDVADGDEITRVAVAHADPDQAETAREISRRWPTSLDSPRGIGAVIRSGEPELLEEIPPELLESRVRGAEHVGAVRELDLGSVMIVPMKIREEILGAITMVTSGSARPFGKDDIGFALELASRAAMAVDNARTYGEAQRALRVRDELASIVSHDLRNALGAIDGAARLLLELPLTEERRRQQLEVIKRSAELMDRLTQDLIDARAIMDGQLSLELAPQDILPLFRETRETWRSELERKSIEFRARVPEALPPFRFDRERMLQVLNNLVGNAVKFTPEGGSVELVAEAAASGLRVEVRDTGPGIPEAERGHVFERFWRSTESEAGGLGLGLAIAREVVEAHGGEIGVGGEVGEGAVFRFTLPISDG